MSDQRNASASPRLAPNPAQTSRMSGNSQCVEPSSNNLCCAGDSATALRFSPPRGFWRDVVGFIFTSPHPIAIPRYRLRGKVAIAMLPAKLLQQLSERLRHGGHCTTRARLGIPTLLNPPLSLGLLRRLSRHEPPGHERGTVRSRRAWRVE